MSKKKILSMYTPLSYLSEINKEIGEYEKILKNKPCLIIKNKTIKNIEYVTGFGFYRIHLNESIDLFKPYIPVQKKTIEELICYYTKKMEIGN